MSPTTTLSALRCYAMAEIRKADLGERRSTQRPSEICGLRKQTRRIEGAIWGIVAVLVGAYTRSPGDLRASQLSKQAK